MRLALRTALVRAEQGVSYLAVALAIVSAILSVITNINVTDQRNRDAARVQCQTSINREFLDTLKARAAIGNASTTNINTLIQALFKPGITTAQAETAYQDYLKELAKINGELQSATYPSIGDC